MAFSFLMAVIALRFAHAEAATAAAEPACKGEDTCGDAVPGGPTQLLQSSIQLGDSSQNCEDEDTCLDAFAVCPIGFLQRALQLGDRSQESTSKSSLTTRFDSDAGAAPLSDAVWGEWVGREALDYRDMVQGQLGDCYFLAALTSIVASHPKIVRGMFTDAARLQGAHPVYTTQWMINGKRTAVAMDDWLPTDPATGDLFFAKPKDESYWPALLEKAWAKIFADYKTIEGGLQREVFKAITQAPVVSVNHKDVLSGQGMSKTAFWNLLVDATRSKYLMGASTGSSCGVGLYCGHAYTLLGAYTYNSTYPQALKMYNPHGADRYNGALPNADKGDGIFSVTYDELLGAFSSVDISEVIDGAVVSDIVLSRASQRTTALEFHMPSDGPFAVQLEWPSNRFFSSACRATEPVFTVAVARKDLLTGYMLLTKQAMQMTNARASLPGGAGTYVVFVSARFPHSKGWLQDFVVNVYGPRTSIAPSTQYSSPIDLFLAMQGLCRTIMVPGTGAYTSVPAGEYTLDESTEVNGMPIFRGNTQASYASGKRVLSSYAILFWSPRKQTNTLSGTMTASGRNEWQITTTVQEAEQGITYPSFRGIPGASCSASLLQLEPQGELGAPVQDPGPAAPSTSRVFDEDGAPLGEGVALQELGGQTAAPGDSGECGKYVQRLASLDNGAEIASTGKDALFPATMASIARPGQSCGDSATGVTASCSKFDHWQTLRQTRQQAATLSTLAAQCKADCSSKPECVTKTPKDGKCLVDFSKCASKAPVRFECDDGAYTGLRAVQYSLYYSDCFNPTCKVA